jgi:hypothetical protein
MIIKDGVLQRAGAVAVCVMHFGLCNSPVTVERLIVSVLMNLTNDACLVYLDDIIVVGRTFQ